MREALAVLGDSFRLLQAKKLFWIVLGISLTIALMYASIGFDDKGMTALFGLKKFENPVLQQGKPEAAAFYVLLFTDFIVRFWLGWFAIALALLSTVSIFPDFIAEGSIEISLSKRVGRLRLFLLKYLGGLLFVILQMAIFTLIVFLALGFRVEEWNLSVFWAIPVVTFAFSLLYVVAVLIGVWTKSALFALLGAAMLWGCTLLGQWTEQLFYDGAHFAPEAGVSIDYKTGKAAESDSVEKNSMAVSAHEMVEKVIAPLPKTRDCTLYLKRLIHMEERDSLLSGVTFDMLLSGEIQNPKLSGAVKRMEERHSAWYVFGTSAIFEAVVLALAAFVFCRRDY